MEGTIKKMAELLKSGASMLSEVCPNCRVPLFKMGREVFCPSCGKRVILVKRGEDESKYLLLSTLTALRRTLDTKVRELNEMIAVERDIDLLGREVEVLNRILHALELISRLTG